MDRMSVADAARVWGVSERLVQKWCAEGAIPGVEKFGRSWSIPLQVGKPSGVRSIVSSLESSSALSPMPLMGSSFVPGRANDCVAGIDDDRLRDIANAELHYFRGEPELATIAAEPHVESENAAVALSSNLICAYANLPLGRPRAARQALGRLRDRVYSLSDETPPSLMAFARLAQDASKVLLHLPIEGGHVLSEDLSALTPGLRMFALYVRAHAAYLQEEYGLCVGLAEGALAMGGGSLFRPFTCISLR